MCRGSSAVGVGKCRGSWVKKSLQKNDKVK